MSYYAAYNPETRKQDLYDDERHIGVIHTPRDAEAILKAVAVLEAARTLVESGVLIEGEGTGRIYCQGCGTVSTERVVMQHAPDCLYTLVGGEGVMAAHADDTPQVKILKRIRDLVVGPDHAHSQAWDTQDDCTRSAQEPPEAGWIFSVDEDGAVRKYRIVVTTWLSDGGRER
jgi:hypothetical protein